MEGDVSPWIINSDATEETIRSPQLESAVILPAQHRAYAIQWFALALTALIIWSTLGWKRARHSYDGIEPRLTANPESPVK
jgi:cytochrome oxidase assembly protein ShyY1